MMSGHSWGAFERRSPELAAVGRMLLAPQSEVAIGFLATAGRRPHLAPVCPIFCDEHVYLSVAAGSPKRRDLDATRRYVLHAFLGAGDAEFQVAGTAQRVEDSAERARVHGAIRFGAYDRSDPIYRLWIERCLYVYWENTGRPDTRAVRRSWRAAPPPRP